MTQINNVYNNIKAFFIKYSLVKKILSFFLLFIFIWIIYEILSILKNVGNDNLQTIRTAMLIPLFYVLIRGGYLYGKGELDLDKILKLSLIAGFTLRIGYAFYTGTNSRQHDVEMYKSGNVLNLDGGGHFTYTYIIYSTFQLPSSLSWQFYHPPLWHFISAIFMHVYGFFKGSNDIASLYSATVILSSFVGCITLYYCQELAVLLFKKDISIAIMALLLALHPQFFIMSGWVNNDNLAFMFMIIAFYYAYCFHLNRNWKDIIICAISIGLGAMSKLVTGLVCIPIGIIFIYDFIVDIRNKTYKKTILQGIVFILIVCPLTLWFVIYTKVRFNISAFSVPSIDPYKNSLGVIQYSYWERFGIPNLFDLKNGIWCILRPNNASYQDCNVWLYTLKCSIFGEYSYWQGYVFAVILLIANLFMIIITLICLVYSLVKNIKSFKNILMAITFVTCLFAYLVFQVKHPVTCTQDFRYMTLILIPGTYFIGNFFEQESNTKLNKVTRKIFMTFIIMFISSSTLFYISCR